MKRAELRPLTSLRFFAALLVFVTHCCWAWGSTHNASYGYLGVGFFFLLSGFILSYTYESFAQSLNCERIKKFLVARFARIYPIYALALLAFIVVEWRSWVLDHPVQNALVFLSQALLLQSWIPSPSYYFGGNEVAWSISDEAFFYIAFPFALYAVGRLLSTCKSSAFIGVAMSVWALYVASIHWHLIDSALYTLYLFPPIRFIDFFVGLLIGMAFTRVMPERRILPKPFATFCEVLAIGFCLLVVFAVGRAPLEYQYAAVAMPIWAATIYLFAFQSGVVSQWLSNSRLMYLGEISYAFYILHFMIIQRIQAIPSLGDTSDMRLRVVLVMVSFLIALWMSHIMHQEIEKPLRNRILASKDRLARF